MTRRTVVAAGALVFTEQFGHNGVVLNVSTAGGWADLDGRAAAQVGAALLDWARQQALAGGCTAGGDCPRHPRLAGIHDPAFAEMGVMA